MLRVKGESEGWETVLRVKGESADNKCVSVRNVTVFVTSVISHTGDTTLTSLP